MTYPVFASRQTTIPGRLLATACIIAIGAFLVSQIWDIDIWWHLAIGMDILARHAAPLTDHFSAAAFGRPYHDSHWLFQVVMALADRVAGMVGVQAMMILGWSAAFWFRWRSISHHASSPVNGLLLFLAAMASIERFHPCRLQSIPQPLRFHPSPRGQRTASCSICSSARWRPISQSCRTWSVQSNLTTIWNRC